MSLRCAAVVVALEVVRLVQALHQPDADGRLSAAPEGLEVITVYISIGNSDDKLSQSEWSTFVRSVDDTIDHAAQLVGVQIHGRWLSPSAAPWQNACWCVAIDESLRHVYDAMRERLAFLADRFRQDSIAWAVAETEFIGPAK